jgi:hypothetical protein
MKISEPFTRLHESRNARKHYVFVLLKERERNDLAFTFQAYDEGSIPFTRSNLFKDLCHSHRAILTSGLLLILTIVRALFARPCVSERRRPPVSSSA